MYDKHPFSSRSFQRMNHVVGEKCAILEFPTFNIALLFGEDWIRKKRFEETFYKLCNDFIGYNVEGKGWKFTRIIHLIFLSDETEKVIFKGGDHIKKFMRVLIYFQDINFDYNLVGM